MALRRTLILARLNLLENARKQVFHVLVLGTVVVIFSSTLLSFFTLGVQVKVLKDLCLASIMLSAGMIAIALGCGSIPTDVENKTIYPILARPLRRWEYVMGKYLGTLITTIASVAVMTLAFSALLFRYQHHVDTFMFTAIGFVLLESAVLAGITVLLSTFATPVAAAVVSFLVFVLGTVKIGYLATLLNANDNGTVKVIGKFLYHLIPNLECFNFKDALVHGVQTPTSYLLLVAAYGVLYAAFTVGLACAIFARREL
ncbi:MAG: ABC transporter permease subunit [Armatimonadota bacterium]|nr:ABC transporter permease subunit [Armatimonadota bacterium]